jgi:hypothetical protein
VDAGSEKNFFVMSRRFRNAIVGHMKQGPFVVRGSVPSPNPIKRQKNHPIHPRFRNPFQCPAPNHLVGATRLDVLGSDPELPRQQHAKKSPATRGSQKTPGIARTKAEQMGMDVEDHRFVSAGGLDWKEWMSRPTIQGKRHTGRTSVSDVFGAAVFQGLRKRLPGGSLGCSLGLRGAEIFGIEHSRRSNKP